MEKIKLLTDAIAFIKRVFFRERAFQRTLDIQADQNLANNNSGTFEGSREVDFIIRRSRNEFGYALRPGQYKAIVNFKKKHQLTRWEISAGLKTGVFNFKGKRNIIDLNFGGPGAAMLVAGFLGSIATISWYLYCRYKLIPSISELFNPTIVDLVSYVVFAAVLFYMFWVTCRYYFEGFRIRSIFKKRSIIKYF
ncbi:hypothetical protein [Sphingobacterium thalpophilum]|uniref:hypothetical protein n=1 Tax=Sphingobacterium thalpophilum TaxID=259 RepID=UPI003D98090F